MKSSTESSEIRSYTVIVSGIPYKVQADDRVAVGHVLYFRIDGKVKAEFNAERIDGIIEEQE